jgi:hypothetical protein
MAVEKFPKVIPTTEGRSWRLVQQAGSALDEGAQYEYDDTGTVGTATGRLTAAISPAELDKTSETLSKLGLKVSVLHRGKSAAAPVPVKIEHSEKMGALRQFEKIAAVKGVTSLSAEILMEKSKR